MTGEQLIAEGRRLARPCSYLRTTGKNFAGVWRGQGIIPYQNGPHRHWLTVDCNYIPGSWTRLSGCLSIYTNPDDSTTGIVAVDDSLSLPDSTDGVNLHDHPDSSLPPLEAVFKWTDCCASDITNALGDTTPGSFRVRPMTDRASSTSSSASGTGPVGAIFRTEDERRAHSKRERSIEVVVLLDFIAGTLGMITAGIYVMLKVLNEQIFPGDPQNLVFRLMVETQRFARALGLARIPGLSEDRAIWNFTSRSVMDSFLIGLALIHLVASAACLGLGYAVARRRPWARLTQAILAALALVLIVAYAVAYTVSDAPRAGLVAIAGAAIVPAWVAYVLMSRTGASAFSVGDQDVTDRTLPPRSPIPFLVRFMLGGIVGLFVAGCLAAFFWVSVPIVILLRRFTL